MKSVASMNNTYYFRMNELGFFDWCMAYSKCKSFISSFKYLSTNAKEDHKREYKESRLVVDQYEVLISSLNKEQQEFLRKYFIANISPEETKESFILYKEIFSNWLEIVFPNKELRIKYISAVEVGKYLRNARINADYSMEQVAGALGISSRAIRKYENGEMFPKLDIYFAMLEIYDC